MPRLTKAQREARDERKTAMAAQLAADAQTMDLPPGSIDVPPPPSASALSTNQPQAAAAVSETLGLTTGSSSNRRSPSAVSEAPARAESPGGSPSTVAAATGPRRSRSPVGAASEMSTSEGSDNEEDGKDKSMAVEGAADEVDGDDDDDTTAANSGNIPEVKCMWEDCGQVFTSLAPFINHLHDGEKEKAIYLGDLIILTPSNCRPRRNPQSSLCLRVDRLP
jgi:hypothetical protein